MPFELPRAERPEEVGLSTERLQRLTEGLSRDIDAGIVPGAVALVARHGKVAYHQALGFRDRDAKAPMRLDTMFRLASMTKPLTTVAAMMLAEEGRLFLADPVARYLPELDGLKVAANAEDPDAKDLVLEPCHKPMTVQDLLRHTSGLSYAITVGPALRKAWTDAGIGDIQYTNKEFITRLSQVPLAYQPGTTWQYGFSTDVLGCVVEAVSGMALDDFITQRICGRLGMTNTTFDAVEAERVAVPQIDPATGKPQYMPREATKKPTWISGGSGLMSTPGDYVRFCQMLLNGGVLGDTRLLSPTTVALMSSDHLPPDVRYGRAMRPQFGTLGPFPESGMGFGLGFTVRTHPGRSALPGSVGDYSWSGVTGTFFWIDPQKELIAILMTQAPNQRHKYRHLMRALVYQAIVA